MKRKSICLRMRLHWLILLLLSDVFFVFLVWLANPDALESLGFIILLYTLLSVVLGYAIDQVRINVRLSAAEDFLERQGEYEEQELLAVADAGLLMPPKSTWFEPKLRSGIFIHKLGE